MNNMINPNSEEFHLFLLWLVNDKDYNDASFILDVVYSSHKYKNLMKEYLNKKG